MKKTQFFRSWMTNMDVFPLNHKAQRNHYSLIRLATEVFDQKINWLRCITRYLEKQLTVNVNKLRLHLLLLIRLRDFPSYLHLVVSVRLPTGRYAVQKINYDDWIWKDGICVPDEDHSRTNRSSKRRFASTVLIIDEAEWANRHQDVLFHLCFWFPVNVFVWISCLRSTSVESVEAVFAVSLQSSRWSLSATSRSLREISSGLQNSRHDDNLWHLHIHRLLRRRAFALGNVLVVIRDNYSWSI